ncbi:MAG TPA: histidine phosphatase family protein [Tepidisphaeraceae bacterium]|nr:histidine phosphatase family protein [Tepidisphaeraceae bacterium]
MPRLILIKHAAPVVDPDQPPERWPLSEDGRARAMTLAERIASLAPARVLASRETKATQTAEVVASRLQIPFVPADDLHEHDRSNVPHMPSREFISMIELFFRKPHQLVTSANDCKFNRKPHQLALGFETADAARERIAGAVDRAIEAHPSETLAVVSHGTVISLLLQQRTGEDPFFSWRAMKLPSFLVIDLPSWRVEQRVNDLTIL